MKTTQVLAFVASFFLAQATFAQSAQFKGYVALERSLTQRLLEPGTEEMKFTRYIPVTTNPYVNSLLDLLGTFGGYGSNRYFKNGTPNSINMLLYHLVFTSFAEELSNNCVSTTGLVFNQQFAKALERTCQWPAPEAKTEMSMLEFWTSIVGYDAPEEEFQAWRTFFLNSSYQSKSGTETVRAMALAITLNPHFLVRK